jgi:drug/metabolite transporter (DMT)-like permease
LNGDSELYLLLAVGSMLAHALQSTLMARYYREYHPLRVSVVRGFTLGITMLPLVFFAAPGSAARLGMEPELLAGAALSAALGNWAAGKSFYYLPVGIALGGQMGFMVLASVSIGVLLWGETLSLQQGFGIALILAGNLIALFRDSIHLERRTLTGLFYCLLMGLCLAVAFSFVTALSRRVDPLLSAYAWELAIGVVGAMIMFGMGVAGRDVGAPLPLKVWWKILIAAAPTAIGTGCYALAVTMGPMSLVTAVLSTMAVAGAFLGRFVYGERLVPRQWLALGVIVVAVVLIRLG